MNKSIKSGVYALINTQTGKMYIGSSKNIKNRIGQHFAALRSGRHCNKELLKDFNNGDEITYKVLALVPDLHAELFNRETEYIRRAKKNHISLYNEKYMVGDYYFSRSQITSHMADIYCKANTGLSINQFFNRSQAEYNMLYEIMENPQDEQQIREKYKDAIDYQNKNNYYRSAFGISYDEYLKLPKDKQKELFRKYRRKHAN